MLIFCQYIVILLSHCKLHPCTNQNSWQQGVWQVGARMGGGMKILSHEQFFECKDLHAGVRVAKSQEIPGDLGIDTEESGV